MGTINVTPRPDETLKQQIAFVPAQEILNSSTLAAIKEVENMKKNPSKYKSYSDVTSMMEDLLK